ncbi:MAG TPA: DUF4430 domain-containing protein [Candidatus Saccharimonadales bacterium]|nr:DUF4430 domain-containing protein [Candidatus Saccharimonadales bacterium]
MKKITNIFKNISPLLIISAVSFLIALGFWLYPPKRETVQKETTPEVQSATTQVSEEPSPTPTASSTIKTQTIISKASPTSTPQIKSPISQNNQSSNQQSSPSPTPSSTSQTPTFQVSLKINGASAGNVDVPQGSNQCDVLSKALDQGKISSLNMRYESNYGSNAVYQINGIGNPNSVWWVYKVNGNSPSEGCSKVSANSNNNIEWEYKGS